jgi:hypothetical protein
VAVAIIRAESANAKFMSRRAAWIARCNANLAHETEGEVSRNFRGQAWAKSPKRGPSG